MGLMKLYAAALDFEPIAEEFGIQRDVPEPVRHDAAKAFDTQAHERVDRRDIDLVTIDPPGSMDLDQAVAIAKSTAGYTVYYAIADVAAFVTADSLVDKYSRARGQTLYFPDKPARLHPAEISEGSASLLPNCDRPCVLWTIELDRQGEVIEVDLYRALVRSRQRLDYVGLQKLIDEGKSPEAIKYLPIVGQLRRNSSLRSKAVAISMPSQIVEINEQTNTAELAVEPRVQIMDDNSEISLLAGMCAGQMMAQAGIGVVRTLPPAREKELSTFIARIRALGFDLPVNADHEQITAFISSIKGKDAKGMAVMRQALTLLRGAGYRKLTADRPAELHDTHAGVGGYYSHVTAPLRRLIDRYATEYCLSISSGRDVPEWVDQKIDEVIATMEKTTGLANQVDKACLNLTEATVLRKWEGNNFEAAVLDSDIERRSAKIFIEHPPVICRCVGAPPRGSHCQVTLVEADPHTRTVVFAWPAD